MSKKYIRLKTHEGEYGAAHLLFRDYPEDGTVPDAGRFVVLHELIPDYFGPRLVLHLDKNGRPLAMEIVYSWSDLDEDEQNESDERAEKEREEWDKAEKGDITS